MEFEHVSVLLNEVIDYLAPRFGETFVDGTVGAGGHSAELARRLGSGGRLIGIDRDPEALKEAALKLESIGTEVILKQGNFAQMAPILATLGVEVVDGILLDIGVSSPQLDMADRGFSYQADGPLDMRMDPSQALTAKNLVNGRTERELADIIRDYGEERWAKRIAQFIVERRLQQPIETTSDLVEVIKAAIPRGARSSGPHPAKRTFQALRIAVNDELHNLEAGIRSAVPHLKAGGRIGIITFHSLEDKIVKTIFRELEKGCVCPPELPTCVCGKSPEVHIVTRKPVMPTEDELEHNPRSRSAKLRVAERL